MKKIISILVAAGIIAAVIFVGCTKKATDEAPQPKPYENIKVGGLRMSITESGLKVSAQEATNSAGSITINVNGSIIINKINTVGGGSTSSTISRITVTPSEQTAAASSSSATTCPTLSELQTLFRKITTDSSRSLSTTDYCTFVQYVKCVLENPSNYGVSQSDLSSSSIGGDVVAAICKALSCPSCAAITAATPAKVLSTFKFDGSEYSGEASCSFSSSSSSSSYYSIPSSENSKDYFTYSKSSTGSSVSVSVNGKSYSSSSSDDITASTSGNTTTVTAKVKLSSSSSSSSTTYTVTATITCK